MQFKIFQESPNYFFLPRYYGIDTFGPPQKNKLPEGQAITLKSTYALLPHQIVAYDKTIAQLTAYGGGVLSIPCGGGKTKIAIDSGISLGGKVLVIVNKECLMDQWIDAIDKFTGGQASIGIIQQNKIDVIDKDFVVKKWPVK